MRLFELSSGDTRLRDYQSELFWVRNRHEQASPAGLVRIPSLPTTHDQSTIEASRSKLSAGPSNRLDCGSGFTVSFAVTCKQDELANPLGKLSLDRIVEWHSRQ